MAYKMKGHTLPGIDQRSEGKNLADGRAKSSAFQKSGAPFLGAVMGVAKKVVGGAKKVKGVVDKVKGGIEKGKSILGMKKHGDSEKEGAPMKKTSKPMSKAMKAKVREAKAKNTRDTNKILVKQGKDPVKDIKEA
tara:strand:+ start:536 stop:940 length:405 start_codon:yes stop_codon:yes gene_type:complete